MTPLQIFFSELWLTLVVSVILLPVLQLGRRLSLDGNATMFICQNSIKALRGFSEPQRKRSFHEADKQAFPGWRFFLPVLIYAAMLSVIVAMAGTLRKATTLPGSYWLTPVIGGLLAFPAFWVAQRWEVRRIKRFLGTTSDFLEMQSAAEQPK